VSVTVIVAPTSPTATPEAVERWKAAARRAANEHDSEVELRSTDPETGAVTAHLIAYPEGDSNGR
jgi:hypothetical protein